MKASIFYKMIASLLFILLFTFTSCEWFSDLFHQHDNDQTSAKGEAETVTANGLTLSVADNSVIKPKEENSTIELEINVAKLPKFISPDSDDSEAQNNDDGNYLQSTVFSIGYSKDGDTNKQGLLLLNQEESPAIISGTPEEPGVVEMFVEEDEDEDRVHLQSALVISSYMANLPGYGEDVPYPYITLYCAQIHSLEGGFADATVSCFVSLTEPPSADELKKQFSGATISDEPTIIDSAYLHYIGGATADYNSIEKINAVGGVSFVVPGYGGAAADATVDSLDSAEYDLLSVDANFAVEKKGIKVTLK